jgi:sugar phosphate isomerase/epimerase
MDNQSTDQAFVVSGFGDEIADEPAEQLAVLGRLGIHRLDLRGAWGRNVLDFTSDDVGRLKAILAEHDARVSTIASPVGKSDVAREAGYERGRLETALGMAEAFETPLVRIFSFYHPTLDHDASRDTVVERLGEFADRAARAGVTLLLENEVDLWGDTPERCLELLRAVDAPSLRFTLDTGNFAAIGVRSRDVAYALLAPYTIHVQIKDVRTADRAVVAAGDGDGQIPELLADLRRDGYRGYLALEPHLAQAGKQGGFSGPDEFARAARALRGLLASL